MGIANKKTMDSLYTDFQVFEQPEHFRTFTEGLVAQRKQLVLLALVFAAGIVVALTYSTFGGGTLMSGSGVALLGTLAACKYY